MSALADHLWQSTWFAVAAWLLALLVRKDAARIRYWIWLTASLKFFVPFAVLTWVGQQFVYQVEDESALLPIVQHIAEPLTRASVSIEPISHTAQSWLLAIWTIGSAGLLARWILRWLRARLLVWQSVPCDIDASTAPMEMRYSYSLLEPGVVGIRHPVLLMPPDLPSRLSAAQLSAVIAHEGQHVRRHDNLTGLLHSLVEVLFWFHPLVWWIGAKLVETREQACDEAAIQEGSDANVYADAILRVCHYSVESRLACIARATGGDLRARIQWIMSHRPTASLGPLPRAVIAIAALGCVTLPIAAGITVVASSPISIAAGARSLRVSDAPGHAFFRASTDFVYARNVSLRELISHAYGVKANEVKGNMPILDTPRYDLELRAAPGAPVAYQELLADLIAQQFNVELIVRSTRPRTLRQVDL